MTDNRYTLWGTAHGAEDWDESVLLSDATAETVARVKVLAGQDGFRNIRAVLNAGAPPDFLVASHSEWRVTQ